MRMKSIDIEMPRPLIDRNEVCREELRAWIKASAFVLEHPDCFSPQMVEYNRHCLNYYLRQDGKNTLSH